MSRPRPEPRRSGHEDSAIAILVDPVNRAILAALGRPGISAGLSTTMLADVVSADVTQRLVRDRVRGLARHGILIAGDAPTGSWVLSRAGEDLVRTRALMARILTHAAGRSMESAPELREQILDDGLRLFADPVSSLITRRLAEHGSLDPTGLEAACSPAPRRTLYRRLQPLLDAGAVLRTTTGQVPRSTTYALSPAWRSAAAVSLLGAWWAARHQDPATFDFDLEGLLLHVLPTVRVSPGIADGLHHWVITGSDRLDTITLRVAGEGLVLEEAHRGRPSAGGATTIRGTPALWSAALVTDQRDPLEVSGDAEAGHTVVSDVRARLLASMR